MNGRRATARRVAVAAVGCTVLLIGTAQPASGAHRVVTAVQGSAFGYFLDVRIFGTPYAVGPTPAVTLPASGSAGPLLASAPTGLAKAEAATFFSSGGLTVGTQGTLGPAGTVTSSTSITSINTSGQETFTASGMTSQCTQAHAGRTGSTTVTNGTLEIESGNDINNDEDYNDPGEHGPASVPVPANPAPNTSFDGHIHVNNTVEHFRYVFNEHVINADGSLTVYAAHQYILGPTAIGHLYIGKATCGVTAPSAEAVADFNGDRRTDVSVYRPSNGSWYTQSPFSFNQWGAPGDIPVPGDYDGNGTTERAIYRPSNGLWYVQTPFYVVQWGAPGDIPVPADYDGNGTTDVAIFRPSNGLWYVLSPFAVYSWGQPGDVPVPGDYDGDGKAEPGIYRPSNGTWYLRSSVPTIAVWGVAGDIPVPGDYDGNGTTDIAVFRPNGGYWYVRSPFSAVSWGQPGDVPVPGDYDGNGTTDRAIYRPTTGQWYLLSNPGVLTVWGVAGDIPLPLPQAIYRAYFP